MERKNIYLLSGDQKIYIFTKQNHIPAGYLMIGPRYIKVCLVYRQMRKMYDTSYIMYMWNGHGWAHVGVAFGCVTWGCHMGVSHGYIISTVRPHGCVTWVYHMGV